MPAFILIFLIIAGVVAAGFVLVARWIYVHYLKKNHRMENSKTKFTQSLTFKGITIALLVLLLLIPGSMIQDLIRERQGRSVETIQKINDKWSQDQTFCAPLLLVPYTKIVAVDKDKKPVRGDHLLYVTPKELNISASLSPEERHYGIYKTILYKSDIHFEGNFPALSDLKIENGELHFEKAQIAIAVTDLRGVTQNPEFMMGGKVFEATVGAKPSSLELFRGKNRSESYHFSDASDGIKPLVINLEGLDFGESLRFDCRMMLNGSSSIGFVPLGQQTVVSVHGEWASPSFIGSFSPESTIDKEAFSAEWKVLSFNREIPEMWSDGYDAKLGDDSFGVNLIETVDHYQQTMRSAKYSLLFIALTFIVFFFVEIFTRKPIQFFQYALVGIALILFYSLLLSLSEQIGFGWAYFTASAATILLTTAYFHSLIRQGAATIVLWGIMVVLYAFLYVILQVEDLALLFGSIFLFVILGVIMFVSNKIRVGKREEV
jgi:inner membrane protein